MDLPRGSRYGHWDVTVKKPGSDVLSKFNVAGDGNCGLISSILMLDEVVNHEQLHSLIGYNGDNQLALTTLNSAHINASLSCSHSFIDDAGLTSGLWLRQDQVHQILTQYPAVKVGLESGVIKDMTPSSIKSAMDTGDSYVHQGFVGARNTSADNDLDFITNKTLKNEFKNIVINIIYEYKDSLELNTDLEKMVEGKLGKDFTAQIKVELGGNISFETLFSLESDTLTRGFFLSRMNSEHGTKEAVEKIAEIFQHYSEKEISNHSDLEKIVIFQDVCEKAKSESLGLDRIQVVQFSKIQTALEKKLSNCLSRLGLDQTIRPKPPLRQPPRKTASNNSDHQDCLTALGNVLNDFVESLENIFSSNGNNSSNKINRGPDSTPHPREKENFLDAISAFFCQDDRRK